MAFPCVQAEARVRMPVTKESPSPIGPGPAAWVIGTAAVTTVLPEIPPETLAEWQRVVDLTARLARVPASLIMQTERPKHTVLVSSRTEGNPYAVGREYDLHAVLYCQGTVNLTSPGRNEAS